MHHYRYCTTFVLEFTNRYMSVIDKWAAFIHGAELSLHITDSTEQANEAVNVVEKIVVEAETNGAQADFDSLRNDWYLVGKDILNAMHKWEKNGK